MTAHASLETIGRALGLLARGLTTVAVADALGVTQRQVNHWAMRGDFQMRPAPFGGSVHRLADADIVGGKGHGRRLSLADRCVIQVGREQGLSMRKIALMAGVSASTVSRELAASTVALRGGEVYNAEAAHVAAMRRRARSRPCKLDKSIRLRHAVVDLLNTHHSPQQVSGRLRLQYPDDEEMRVSHETIYQALYVQGRGGLRHELAVVKAIRSGRTTRRPRSKLPARTVRPWLDGARLVDRPAQAQDRAVPGHWEGDLVVGPGNSGIITLVERASRFTLISRLPGMRDSTTVTEKLAAMIENLPSELKASITWDQGQEMARHRDFTITTGCPVFFCDPHSPWQRGSNENTNGLIRQFHPKGTNFNDLTDADIAETQRLLNIRARATLNFYTPAEKLNEYIQAVPLTT